MIKSTINGTMRQCLQASSGQYSLLAMNLLLKSIDNDFIVEKQIRIELMQNIIAA